MVIVVPLAKVTVPRVGKPVTVIIRTPLSGSVGAANPNAVFVLSSATFIVLFEATGGQLFTVTSSVSINCIEQLVVALVANTLKVVVAVKFPVGKLIVPPSPATAVPTLVVPVRNW